ncbi:hypothetical protein Syun_029647 [Stephania yunnanensis]|uniref:Uncharacterized protein n=1 Tax=Stephania yunnanensis TaxID=152371 RepID=A0AAP0HG75_9MAGN
MVQLANEEDMHRALLGGPWVILGQYLTVRKYTSSLQATTALRTRIRTWICFPYWSFAYYHEAIGRGLASIVIFSLCEEIKEKEKKIKNSVKWRKCTMNQERIQN